MAVAVAVAAVMATVLPAAAASPPLDQISAFATASTSTCTGPTAHLVMRPASGQAPLTVTADASTTTAGTCPIGGYTFDWGDGSPPTGPQSGTSAPHVYPIPGKYTVTVTVADNQLPAHTASATFAVNVGLGAGPTPSLTMTPDSGVAPLEVTADASGSAPGTSPIKSFAFDFGDGTSVGAQDESRVRHTYTNPGSYTANVTVTDRSGLTSSTTATVTVLPGAPAGSHGSGPLVRRVAGTDRIATGVAVSQLRWDPAANSAPGTRHAGAAVLARADEFADALAGIPLAVKANAPLLLTGPAALDDRVEAELARILPPHGKVYLLGGDSALSAAIETRLRQDGYTTVRLGGTDRFATALAIARQGLGDPAHVVVATGDDFPDALAAGPYAASAFAVAGQPAAIVLTDDRVMPAAAAAYLQSKAAGSTTADPAIVAIGGPGALALAATLPAGRFDALVGADRFDTAARVVPYFTRTAPVGVADGDDFPDALTGGTLMAELSGPVVLAEPDTLDPPTARALHTMKGSAELVDVFGGPVAISDRTLGAVAEAVDGRMG
ncbi:MAG: PKD domain-containing protein [Catenulispora sp.]|nr:PKD domain-containing protein [Catenulispora sp.]